jgi:hypothetical protein
VQARIIKDGLENSMDKSRIFLDSDNLKNLSELLHCVASSDVLVVLLSPGVLTRPWCLMELITAMDRGKPIVGVKCDGLKQGAYQYDTAREFLMDLGANLDATNPGATNTLRDHGVDPDVVGHALVAYLHNPISIPFAVHWSTNMMNAAIVDIKCAARSARSARQRRRWADV